MATTVGRTSSSFAQAPTAAASARVASLLSRMTLDEKIGQMTQINISVVTAAKQTRGRIALDSAKLKEAIVRRHVGSIINVLDGAITAAEWQRVITKIQSVATDETRLGIPIIYGIDFVHGANYLQEGTIFPQNIAMAATFDRALARRAGEITGREARASGLSWNFAPVLDIGRQPLWPRFYESWGEDPFVASELGAAVTAGIQASGVPATMKHYLGYGLPRSGHDRTPASATEREVREYALPSFRAAVRAGAGAVMVNSGELDGEPVHASHHWLTDVLRKELGFEGVVVTDWQDIAFLHTRHHVAATMRDAVRMAIDAGVDMSMTPLDFDFIDTLKALVKDGTIPESRIDQSVKRILTLKARAGLFDSPMPDPSKLATVGAPADRVVGLDASREAITLLKNEKGALPLRSDAKILVTGPAATSLSAVLGGWSYTWQGTDTAFYPRGTMSLLAAMQKHGSHVTHAPIASFTSASDAEIAAAAEAARGADVAVIALGEDAYAEWIGDINDLSLPPSQIRLAQAVAATGTPTVLVLFEGRPRIISSIADSARAIVMGDWPGGQGAEATAEVLFGDANPSGKLPFTYPRAPNALLTYDHRYTETLNSGFDRAPNGFNPQFEFGHGLSYTTFAYTKLSLDHDRLAPDGTLTAHVTVTNTGARPGTETVLLYSRQDYASLTPPVKRLRAFTRVELAPGESKVIELAVPARDLAFVGRDNKMHLEPGKFEILVGGLVAGFSVVAR